MAAIGGLLVVLLAFSASGAAAIGVFAVLEIIKVAADVVAGLAKAWNLVGKPVDFSGVPVPVLDNTEDKILGRIGLISARLDKVDEMVDIVGTNTIHTVLFNLPERIRLELRLNNLLDYLTRMEVNYRRFQEYTDNRNIIERATLEDYARIIVSHDPNSAVSLLERIHAFVVPTGRGVTNHGVFRLLSNSLKGVEGDMLCNAKQSPQQVLYNLYNAVALTELKGYTMIQFAYMLLRMYDKGNFTRESQLVRQRFERRTNNAVEMIRGVMKNASRELWACDPKRHVEGVTYQAITELLQGYIQNEVDLNSQGSCGKTCEYYKYTKNHGCYKKQFCHKQRKCNGKIIDCRFIDSDMWICKSTKNQKNRRYQYIQYKNGKMLGTKQACPQGLTKVDSWWRWLFWHCSYCFCLCDEQGPYSDRYISMKSVVADINNNKVVTGLRFVKKNRIIHLQIQEGQLLPRGYINTSTVHWVPPKAFRITDKNVFNGQDYHTFEWKKRAVDLDDLQAMDGYILTGVRFKEIGSHLNFQIYISKFDFEGGKLISPKTTSTWRNNPNTRRQLFSLNNTDVPTRSPSPSIPTSKSNQYIEFTHSDLYKDAGQTTVPFLDGQPLESIQAVPLAGAGIFHKGRNNFGGFLTPKIITYDFSKHLKAAFSKEVKIEKDNC